MASKLVVFVLVVTVYQVQSKTIYYSSPQSSASSASSNSQASAGGSSSSVNSQASSNNPSSTGPVLFPSQPSASNTNQGIKASPQKLQIIPGQGCNLHAIPVSQLRGIQQIPRNQNCVCSIPRPAIQGSSASKSPQTSPAQLIQPCLTGPASVITSPVSSITIPPTGATTIIDNSLSNSLANALQMMIANEFINSAMNNNIIKECVQIPLVETTAPNFDLATFLQGLNAQQVQAPSENDCDTDTPSQYDWAAIQNFLNQQTQAEKPVTEAAPSTDGSNLNCLPLYNPAPEQTSPQPATYIPCSQQDNKNRPQVYPTDQCGYNSALETLAAYFGCNVSDICPVSSYPNVPQNIPQIVLPEEIPAQLICNYGYMPTTVPVVSFSVQPVGGDSNFIVGCQC